MCNIRHKTIRQMKTFYEQTIIDNIDFSGYEDNLDILGAGSLNSEEFEEEL